MKKTIYILVSIILITSTLSTNIKAECDLNNIEYKSNVKPIVVKLDRNSIVKARENIESKIKIEEEKLKSNYSEDDLYILSHLICGEAGSSWISDEEQLLVGNVVMNRVKSEKFPNTLKEVAFQNGQYTCTIDGNYKRQPDERTINNAKKILNGERFCPENVLYQSNSAQGKIYKKIGSTYFCY